jgi:hypothetical protein
MTTQMYNLRSGVTLTINWALVPDHLANVLIDLHRGGLSDQFSFHRPAPIFTPRKWARDLVAYAHGARLQSRPADCGPVYPWIGDDSFVDRRQYRIHPEDDPHFDELGLPTEPGK